MPATLKEAFRSPFHLDVFSNNNQQATGTTAYYSNNGPSSWTQPSGYAQFGGATKQSSASDLVSEADEIRSVYDSKQLPLSIAVGADRSRGGNASGNTLQVDTTTYDSHETDDGCNRLIAKVLACPVCRRKLKHLLLDSDTNDTDDTVDSQTGGGVAWNVTIPKNLQQLVSNIILGVILVLLLHLIY